MRLPLALTAAALATAFAAGPAQADSSVPAQRGTATSVQPFTPPIGTDKGSVTAPTPTTSNGIIAILIG